ncbi:unknown [Blautia hydrogenotrophica CAG:147]|nr:unknown [Blautia hydrogenotrophica CAG:147]
MNKVGRAAATPPCGALPYCGVRILSGALML